MAGEKREYKTIDEYIAACPAEIQPTLRQIRAVIREAAPDAEERISYQMPTFWQQGNLVHFALHSHHIGFYPTPEGLEEFKGELAGYKGSKGAVQFPLDQPIPYDLILRFVQVRVRQNLEKAAAKNKKSTHSKEHS